MHIVFIVPWMLLFYQWSMLSTISLCPAHYIPVSTVSMVCTGLHVSVNSARSKTACFPTTNRHLLSYYPQAPLIYNIRAPPNGQIYNCLWQEDITITQNRHKGAITINAVIQTFGHKFMTLLHLQLYISLNHLPQKEKKTKLSNRLFQNYLLPPMAPSLGMHWLQKVDRHWPKCLGFSLCPDISSCVTMLSKLSGILFWVYTSGREKKWLLIPVISKPATTLQKTDCSCPISHRKMLISCSEQNVEELPGSSKAQVLISLSPLADFTSTGMIDSKYFSLPAPVSTSLGRGCFFAPCPPWLACDVYCVWLQTSHTRYLSHSLLTCPDFKQLKQTPFPFKKSIFSHCDFFLKASHLSEAWLSWQNKQVVLSHGLVHGMVSLLWCFISPWYWSNNICSKTVNLWMSC